MARTPTTFDPFNAISEPKRRQLIEALAGKELTVNQITELMGWNQPMVSKHLGVLKKVGLVSEKKEGRFSNSQVYRRRTLNTDGKWMRPGLNKSLESPVLYAVPSWGLQEV